MLADGATSSWAQYTVKLPSGTDREAVVVALREQGVPSAIYYPVPMHEQPPYRHYPAPTGGLQVTADLCERVLALPMHPYLEDETQQRIAAALESALATAGAASPEIASA